MNIFTTSTRSCISSPRREAAFDLDTSDAILYAKTMKDLNWKPAIMIADNAGFNDPSFVKTMGSQVEGLINRSAFAAGKPGSVSAIVNEMFKKKTGNDLDDPSARALQGLLIVADAINRAGSTDPAKIQAVLKATDMNASQYSLREWAAAHTRPGIGIPGPLPSLRSKRRVAWRVSRQRGAGLAPLRAQLEISYGAA